VLHLVKAKSRFAGVEVGLEVRLGMHRVLSYGKSTIHVGAKSVFAR